MPRWLFVLLAAAFVLYTDDYVIAGILPEIARDLDVTEGQAGQLVTAFSVTVAVGAPLAAVVTSRLPRRLLFAIALLIFTAANLLAAVVGSFGALLLLRIVAALATAIATPAIFAFAARQAPIDKAGRFIAVISLGVTGSIAVGVPLGTWIGGVFGWRATFLTMGVCGIVVLLAVLITLPQARAEDTLTGVRDQLRVLLQGRISLSLIANCSLMTGSMMMLTYLAPYLSAVAGADVDDRALAFGLAGVAGILGIWLAGEAVDRWGADRTLAIGVGAIVASMLGLSVIWMSRPVPLWLILIAMTFWGGMAMGNSPAVQSRLASMAGPLAGQALALNTSSTYLGVSGGAAIGGVALSVVGPGALPLASAVFVLGSLLLFLVSRQSNSRCVDPPRSQSTQMRNEK
ncbi:MFS transporter [Brevibacterium sp. UCMA 11752]|uniref:MFS transporter n=1 Tax=Brevibacterium sp. UCMA 11752 TaxID=2745946 RepID=UPI001F42F6EA|nr:MFS transporter [Brevibacterium sp. UCMA 11752]MCF2586233.1 MFS transporter [Brevibacterium sp. UCMA 11752]